MASAAKITRGGKWTGYWRARFTIAGKGVERRRDDQGRQFTRKRDAEAYAQEAEAKGRAGSYVDRSASPTVESWARQYVELKARLREHRPSTTTRWKSVIDNQLGKLGAMKLTDVRRPHWQLWEADLWQRVEAEEISAGYARKVIGDVKALFAAAVDQDPPLIARSPAPRKTAANAPKVVKIEKTFTVDEVERAKSGMAAVRPDAVDMVIVQDGMGLRTGELLGLRAKDVDRFRRTVTVGSQINAKCERVELLKTERSKATVRVPQYVIDTLVAHMAAYPTAIDGSVFTRGGVHWTQDQYRQVFNQALKAAGLPATWRPHDLRHYRVSQMIAEGYNDQQIARYVRDTAETIRKTYAHPVDDADEVADEMDRAWRQGSGS